MRTPRRSALACFASTVLLFSACDATAKPTPPADPPAEGNQPEDPAPEDPAAEDPAAEDPAAEVDPVMCVTTTHEEFTQPDSGSVFPSFLTFSFMGLDVDGEITVLGQDMNDGFSVSGSLADGTGDVSLGIRAFGEYFLPEVHAGQTNVGIPLDEPYEVDDDEGAASEVCYDLA